MNAERALIASILFLALGLGLIFGYCHDSTASFSGAYPVAGASLQFVINTNGFPAVAGLAATGAGIVFPFAALVFTVLKLVSPPTTEHRERARSLSGICARRQLSPRPTFMPFRPRTGRIRHPFG